MNKQSATRNQQSAITRVLLIEDDCGDAGLIQEILSEGKTRPFDLECADRLSKGVKHLAEGSTDIVLLDLSLPDSQGLETLIKVHAQAPEVPIVVLTGLNEERIAIEAMQDGAQDYLVKGQVDSNLLVRTLNYAIERQQLRSELRTLLLTDELTSLYNRRGFFSLARQHLKLADRENREILLVFIDLDNLKGINDTLGHPAGDQALSGTADILKKTFRESDIIARLGGDEFAIIAMGGYEEEEGKESAEIFSARLQKNLQHYNGEENRRYHLSLSVGMARRNPGCSCSVDNLLARADKLMYEQKQNKEGKNVQ